MPKRIKHFVIPSDEEFRSIFEDIGLRINAALKNLENAEEERAAAQFLGTFVSDDEKHKESDNWVPSAIFNASQHLWLFYCPMFTSNKTPKFPTHCPYEILIPFRQANVNVIRYMVVPTGAEPGDSVVALSSALVLYLTPVQQSIMAPVLPSTKQIPQIQEIDKWITTFKYAKDRKDELLKDESANTFIKVYELTNEPLFRLPCYDIPLQCAYEMCNADLGDFRYDSFAIWTILKKEERKKITLHREPLDPTIHAAMTLWSLWNREELSDRARVDYLIRVMELEGKICRFSDKQEITLRKACVEMLGDHLDTEKEMARIKIGNSTRYMIRNKFVPLTPLEKLFEERFKVVRSPGPTGV